MLVKLQAFATLLGGGFETAEQFTHLELSGAPVAADAVVLLKTAIEVVLYCFFTGFIEFANLDELLVNI